MGVISFFAVIKSTENVVQKLCWRRGVDLIFLKNRRRTADLENSDIRLQMKL